MTTSSPTSNSSTTDDAKCKKLLDALKGVKGFLDVDGPQHIIEVARHYGILDEILEYVTSNDGLRAGEIALECVFAFRRKANRVVWTEEEFRERVRSGEVSEYDVIRMADGYVPPQDLFA